MVIDKISNAQNKDSNTTWGIPVSGFRITPRLASAPCKLPLTLADSAVNKSQTNPVTEIMSNGILLAISGGHSRSSAFAFRGFEALGAVEGDRINLHTEGPSVATRKLFNLLVGLADVLRFESPEALIDSCQSGVFVSAGAAGAEEQLDILNDLVGALFSSSRDKFTIADDTWAGLLAGTMGYQGTCAFAGTGASVYVGLGIRPTGRERKIDGLGPIIGDFGSGFQLSVDLFRKMGRIANEEGTPPPLFVRVRELINHLVQRDDFPSSPLTTSDSDGLEASFERVQAWFDSLVRDNSSVWRIRFAQLAAAVTDAADDMTASDSLARELVRAAAAQMAESILIAVSRWPEASEHSLIFQGGMFEHSLLYRQTVCELTSNRFKTISFPRFKPLMGAALMALAPTGSIPDLEAVQALTTSILQLSERQNGLLIRANHDAQYPTGIRG